MTVVKFKYQSSEVTKKATRDLFQNLTSGMNFKSNADEIEICFRDDKLEMKIIDALLTHNPIEVSCAEVTPIISMTEAKTAGVRKVQHKTPHPGAAKTESEKSDIDKILDTIAAESSSFNDFAERVSKNICRSKDTQEVLRISIRFAADSKNVNLKQISERMCRSYSTLTGLGSMLSKQIGTTLLELLKKTTSYKEYHFKEESDSEKSEPLPEPSPEPSDEADDSEKKATTEAKEPSKSQNKEQDLEYILKNTDMSNLAIEARVNYVLGEMGLRTFFKEFETQQAILRTVINAVQMKEISWKKAVFEGEDADTIKMNISTLVNNFLGRNENEPKMKAKDFVQMLQEKIMFPSEIYN